MPVKLALFQKLQDPAYAQRLMKEAIIKAAGVPTVKFVAAKNYKIGAKMLPLFLVVDKPAEFVTHLKQQKLAVVSIGEAAVTKDTGNKHKVLVKRATGGLSPNAVSVLLKPALGNDAKFVGTTPEREQAEREAEESEAARRPKPNAADLAKASHAQARKEGKLDWEFTPTPDVLAQMTKVSQETAQYKEWAGAFAKLAEKYKFPDYKKVPVNIWRDMLKGLATSGYVRSQIPTSGSPGQFILAYKGPQGEVMREALLKKAMEGLAVYTAHAEKYLDKVVDEVTKSGGGKPWAFWSGTGAQQAARKEASDGIVLEGSVGSWFDKVWTFEALTGVADLALWAAMSEMYAKKAAEHYKKFRFVGFLGPGATREQSVFNKIEQPTFIQVLNARQTVAPPTIRWYVVDCDKNGSRWEYKGKPSLPAASRAAALDDVRQRYGG